MILYCIFAFQFTYAQRQMKLYADSYEYEMTPFHNGIALLVKDGMVYGHTNTENRTFMFGKPYHYNPKFPFYTEGYLVVGRPNILIRNKIQWFYIDEAGNRLETNDRFYAYAEPFFAGYAVVKVGDTYRHIDMAGNYRFNRDGENVIFRSGVYWGGGENDSCECVIVTDTGIHLCEEEGETAVIKESLYVGNTIQKYDEPDSFGDSSGGVLLFNKFGQAEVYDDGKGKLRWLIPLRY